MITPVTSPVAGAKLTSPYGMRTSPTSGRRVLHAGQDLGTPSGTPVLAVAPGVVRVSQRDTPAGCRGEYIVIDHGDGWDTRYFHLSQRDVHVGDVVQQGQRVGLSGQTGCVTGPHLHFEVWQDDVPVDPRSILSPVGAFPNEGADEDEDEDQERDRPRHPIRVRLDVGVPPEAVQATQEVADNVRTLGYILAGFGIATVGATVVALLK